MELTAYSKLNPCEFVHFASKSRAHSKQGILSDVHVGFAGDPDRHEEEALGQAFFSPEAVKALTGTELSVTERLKVDEGALAEVLREEGKDDLEAAEACNNISKAFLALNIKNICIYMFVCMYVCMYVSDTVFYFKVSQKRLCAAGGFPKEAFGA